MVFAVAALFFQLAPGAFAPPIVAAPEPITLASEATTGPTAPAPLPDASLSHDAESSAHYKFDKVSLATGSKESSTPKLNAVSLESTTDIQTLSNIRVPEIQPGAQPLHSHLVGAVPGAAWRCSFRRLLDATVHFARQCGKRPDDEAFCALRSHLRRHSSWAGGARFYRAAHAA
jgi:hypothetical protein